MITRRLFTIIVGLLFTFPTQGRTIHVGSAQSITTIRQGIHEANDGDTLLVHKGFYQEGNLIIEKSIHLIGMDYPILDGENQVEIMTIHGHDITIQGFIFQNTGITSIQDLAGIKVLESQRIKIIHNQFKDTFFGIYLANSSHCWIERNQLEANAEAEHQIGNGIHLWKCEFITITENKIKGHRDGIYFEFVTNSLITKNHSEGNMRYGLHFMFSHRDEYRENTFVNNGAGVAVMYTKDVHMINNRFDHNWGPSAYGLLLKDIRDSFIENNFFTTNSVGIFMEGSSRNQIRKNSFKENGYAIKLQASCDDNNFQRNNFQQNTFDMVTNGTLVLNHIEQNYWDRYEGYDLNQDKVGDVPYRPISMYGRIVEQVPTAILLWRSFLVFLLDRAEKGIPVLTPENLKDDKPNMTPHDFH